MKLEILQNSSTSFECDANPFAFLSYRLCSGHTLSNKTLTKQKRSLVCERLLKLVKIKQTCLL